MKRLGMAIHISRMECGWESPAPVCLSDRSDLVNEGSATEVQ